MNKKRWQKLFAEKNSSILFLKSCKLKILMFKLGGLNNIVTVGIFVGEISLGNYRLHQSFGSVVEEKHQINRSRSFY